MEQRVITKILPKARLVGWLEQLICKAEVIAPCNEQDGELGFATISSPEQICWRFVNVLQPPKRFLLPQTDPIASIRRGEHGHTVLPIRDDKPRILFNIRSCDVRAIEYLTRVHTSDLVDDTYVARVEGMTFISLACTVPGPRCFCTCFGAGPFLKDGYDIQLIDLGPCLLAESGSEDGRALLDEAADMFRTATESELSQRTRLEEDARQRFGEATCHLASAMRRVSTGRVPEELWSRMSDGCLECGGCNMICPTCYCFSVKDRKEDGGWVRCRIWDSCQYAAFTLEASGHNPRKNRKDRMKRRFFHKISAQYYARDNMPACVGCGRCSTVCMGATDMPSVVGAIRSGVWHG